MKETKYCPVEHRTVDEAYCDSINCEMCEEGVCLGHGLSGEERIAIARNNNEPVEEDGELLYPDEQGNYTIRDN